MKWLSKNRRRPLVEQLENRCIPGSVLDLLTNPLAAPLGQSLVLLEATESAAWLLMSGVETNAMPAAPGCPGGRAMSADPCLPGPFGRHAATQLEPSLRPLLHDSGADVLLVVAGHTFAQQTHGVRVLWGESTIIGGARLTAWALVSARHHGILAVGGSVSMRLIEDQPHEPGPFPAGAIASLDFPEFVQRTTYFNHLEVHSQAHGHPISPLAADPDRYRVPHFDLHFYAVPEEQVWAVPGLPPPLPPVAADRLPAGYAQPGPSELEMGRHAGPLSELAETGPFSAVMIAGFTPDGTQMHFVEPMITRELLLRREDFALPVPRPEVLGWATQYPTRFAATFHGNAYHFVFSDFVSVR